MRADISDISVRIDLLESVSREAARELEKLMTEMRANNSELKLSIFELNETIKGIVKNSTRSPPSSYTSLNSEIFHQKRQKPGIGFLETWEPDPISESRSVFPNTFQVSEY